MNAITYYSYDDIRLENRSIPPITKQELLVKVHGCGLCGSDINKIVQQAPPPVKLGHELTGTVVERGREVANFSVGQRVIVAHHVPCGACHYCCHANYSMCASFKTSNIDPCGFAEYIRVPAEHVQHTTLPLPDTLSAEEGSFIEPLACCVRAVRRTPLLPGDSVVVMGLGSIGLLMLQAVKALLPPGRGQALALPMDAPREPSIGRARACPRPAYATPPTHLPHPAHVTRPVRVYGVDLLPERLQLARVLGADDVFLAPGDEQGLRAVLEAYTGGRGADAIIITTAGTRPFLQAMAGVRKGGAINIFAAHAGTAAVNLENIYLQELSISSTYSSSPEDLRVAFALLAERRVRVDGLISHRLPLEQFAEGVTLMRERAALKVYFQIAGES